MAFLVLDPLLLSGLSAGLGIISHLAYFIHGEHHNSAPTLALLFFAIPFLLFVGQLLYTGVRASQAALITTIVCMSYICALWTSMIIYRVFFHRLHNFPGPFMAKTTKIFHLCLSAPKSDNHVVVDRMHRKYGPFVRTGPCEISVAAPEGPLAILGPNSKCIKAPWYDGGLPLMSLHTARVKSDHDRRRKVWEPGFTTKALRNYEKRIIKYTQRLMSQISAFGGEPFNVTAWMGFFGFDIMGDLAFGKSFDMLESGKQHFALKLMLEGQSYLGYMGLLPWVTPIAVRIPGAMKHYEKWVEWSVAQVEARRKMEVSEPDVMSWLLEATKDAQDPREDANWLSGDSRLIIVAGSDTSATTMTNVFYYLAKYPAQYAKLRAELSAIVKSTADFKVNDVRDAPHLNGCINEALRIRPPVPSAIYRLTPPGGIMVGDRFIPGGVTVSSPMWTLGKLESIYPQAKEFIPERWYSRPELLKTKDAFAPFSLGTYGCIGKQLAYMEMRTVITLLVLNYKISFAPGEDGKEFYEKTVDIFTMALGELKLLFEKIENV